MRTRLALFCTLAAIAFGISWVVQGQKLAEARRQLVSIREKLDEASKQLDKSQAAQKRSAKQRAELLRRVNDLAAQVQERQVATVPTNAPMVAEGEKPDEESAALAKALIGFQNDPETKKTIREHQRLIMERRYGSLIQRMGLTPEEADKFKDLIGDSERKTTLSLLSNDFVTTNSLETLNKIVAAQKHLDEEVKQLLGDGRFAQYQDYKQMVGEREQFRQFESEVPGNALTDQQREQLLTVMKEEKQQVIASTGLPVSGFAKTTDEFVGEDLSSLPPLLSKYSEDQLDELFFQAQQRVNQRVYERAKAVLRPEQLEAFGAYQTHKLEEMRP
jgi:hypothetical protein